VLLLQVEGPALCGQEEELVYEQAQEQLYCCSSFSKALIFHRCVPYCYRI